MMKNIISKGIKILSENLEQQCLELKKDIKNEKVEKSKIEDYILRIEIEIQNADIIIKIEELITIPVMLATYGMIFSLDSNDLHKGIAFLVVFLLESLFISYIYFQSVQNKFYAEKMLKYYKDKLENIN